MKHYLLIFLIFSLSFLTSCTPSHANTSSNQISSINSSSSLKVDNNLIVSMLAYKIKERGNTLLTNYGLTYIDEANFAFYDIDNDNIPELFLQFLIIILLISMYIK